MITLIIVDPQNDFVNPDGSMFMLGAPEATKSIVDFISKNSDKIHRVIITEDKHPEEHCSFKEWPPHCIVDTWGALTEDSIYNAVSQWKLNKVSGIKDILSKGQETDIEEYSAFIPENWEDCDEEFETVQDYVDKFNSEGQVVVCGVAGDYCVAETIKDLIKLGCKPIVYLEGIASIDGGEILNDLIENNCLAVW